MFSRQDKITRFLWDHNQAADASALYTRLFGHGRVPSRAYRVMQAMMTRLDMAALQRTHDGA